MGPRPPIGASLIAGLVLFALLLAMPGILADPDTLWQVRTGEWILRHRAFPHADPFSYTALGKPWFTHEWLAETLMGLANYAGGFRGVMVLTAAAAGLAAGMLLHHLRRFMAPLAAVMVMLLGIANCAGSLLARPHVLAWPCLELWCAGLVLARARRARPSWLLLPVMVLWVNLHGSFMIGLLLPLAFLAEATIEAVPNRREAVTGWAAFTAAAWFAALLNPDLLAGELFPFRLLGMRNLDWIGEWTPADFSAFRPLELTILILLGIGLLGRLTVPPFRLLMLLGLVHLALRHWRHDQLLGLIGALLLAESIGRLAPPREAPAPGLIRPSLIRHGLIRSGLIRSGLIRIGLPAAAALLAAIAVLARCMMPLDREPGVEVLAALDKLPAELRARPVLNDYGYGAYLIFHGDRPFIDSRADLYGDAFLGRFREVTELKPGALATALRDYHVAWTIFPPDAPVLLALDQQPGWHRLPDTAAIVVHVRDAAIPP
jgi:hypothetical protein